MEFASVQLLPHPQLFEYNWLPRAPLAGPGKSGPHYRTTRAKALTLPYVEANPLAMQSLIITDHDHGSADEIAGLLGLPRPTYVALNPHTRDGHIVYALAAPVCLTDSAHRAPVNLLARVESGLCSVLGGDVAYGGRITKNPTHQDHLPIWGDDAAIYGLRDLASALDILGALPKYTEQKTLTNSAVGRNVALFDLVRKWAYRRRGEYTDPIEWEEVAHAYAQDRNLALIGPAFSRGPLDRGEVTHLARSISRWTWRKITRTFEQEQAHRGHNGGKIGGKKTGPTKARGKIDRATVIAVTGQKARADGC
ncbi:MAG: replication initiation protein [Nakamurella sp.]